MSDWLEFETKKYSGRTVFERHTIATNEIMGCACELCDSTDLSVIGTRSANKNIVANLEMRSSSIQPLAEVYRTLPCLMRGRARSTTPKF